MSSSERDVPPRPGPERTRRSVRVDEERLVADAHLVQLIRDEMKDPDRPHRPAYEALADSLVSYTIPVLRAWLSSGQLFTRMRQLGVHVPGLLASERAALFNDADDLIFEATADAFQRFSERTLQHDVGGWNPDGGTSLKTYFVNTAVLGMGNHIRAWRRARRRTAQYGYEAGLLTDDLVATPPSSSPGPLEVVLERESRSELFDALDRTDPVLVRALHERIETGRSWSLIADELGLSARALEGRLRRARDRLTLD